MRLKGGEAGKRRARKLRREMTLPEVLLWSALRGQDLRFRKQHPAGPYTLDFYCAPAELAIEVDGEVHDRGEQPGRDAIRDTWFEERGVTTLRIPAADILNDLDAVLRYVLAQAAARLPPPPLAARAVPLPR